MIHDNETSHVRTAAYVADTEELGKDKESGHSVLANRDCSSSAGLEETNSPLSTK